MKMKMKMICIVIAAVFLCAAWLTSTPARAAGNLIVRIIFTIHPDGSGETVYEVNTDLVSEVDPTLNLEESCLTSTSNGTEAHIETRNGAKWCISESTFANLEELGYTGDNVNELTLENGRLTYNLEVDFNNNDFDLGKYNVEWKVVAPGKVSDHNADKVSGCTLTWLVDEGITRNFIFSSNTDGKCSQALLTGYYPGLAVGVAVVCCCLLLIVIIGVVVYLVLQKRRKQPVM